MCGHNWQHNWRGEALHQEDMLPSLAKLNPCKPDQRTVIKGTIWLAKYVYRIGDLRLFSIPHNVWWPDGEGFGRTVEIDGWQMEVFMKGNQDRFVLEEAVREGDSNEPGNGERILQFNPLDRIARSTSSRGLASRRLWWVGLL